MACRIDRARFKSLVVPGNHKRTRRKVLVELIQMVAEAMVVAGINMSCILALSLPLLPVASLVAQHVEVGKG